MPGQLLRDAEGSLQKRDRVLRQPLRLRVQRRDLRQERLEPEGLRSGVLRAGDELRRGDIEAFGDLFNGIRPQAVFSFQIARNVERGMPSSLENSSLLFFSASILCRSVAAMFFSICTKPPPSIKR